MPVCPDVVSKWRSNLWRELELSPPVAVGWSFSLLLVFLLGEGSYVKPATPPQVPELHRRFWF